jgi:hypothetical protein
MWGNTKGWIISAILVIAFTTTVCALQMTGTTPSGMTPAFAARVASLEPIRLPTSPDSMVRMSDDCNAADAYREAIRQYEANPSLYETFRTDRSDQYAACEQLVLGTHCRDMTLWTKNPEALVNWDREKEPLVALQKVGHVTALRALAALKSNDLSAATAYGEAAFALGAKLAGERIVYDEFEAGLGLMGEAAPVLRDIAKARHDSQREGQIDAFDKARQGFMRPDGPIYDLHVITANIDGNVSGARAGDVFYLAQHSPERLWRVEACFQLARIHRNVGDNGRASDQRYAQMLLRRIADTDTDPIVKLAATKARDVTDAEYNRQ